MMALVFEFCFLLIYHILLVSAGYGHASHDKCPRSFECGKLGSIVFPLTKVERPDCGLIKVHNCDDPNPSSNKAIELDKGGNQSWLLTSVLPQLKMIGVFHPDLHTRLQSCGSCEAFNKNFSIPAKSPLISFDIKYNISLFKCHNHLNVSPPTGFIKNHCAGFDIYHYRGDLNHLKPVQQRSFSACSTLVFPKKDWPDTSDLQSFLSAGMMLDIRLSDDCDKCYHHLRGQCKLDSTDKFYCDKAPPWFWKLALGLGIGLFGGVLGTLIILLRLRKYYKRKYPSPDVQLQITCNNTNDPYFNEDTESGRIYLGVPLFSYEELKKATNNFDRSNELGNGGFGSVYYGKLQDGREVAVKRLYDHNCRRVEQFMNEIEILTRLRHRNLVSLYGCTSCHSHELLLVYEYIPNKTVSCHLHGESSADHGLFLPWPVRIKIAIETATTLAFLHASDTIHRDVKTNNILLDNNFSVKVADFGLSRLFPDDVTHVSTAPQGTPGYVDPDYHQCYQLTSKSDVYSFGVVLIELISSLPAVDITRSRDEINLANLAINKIQKSAFEELVDPCLGFESNNEVRRMIISVAELAFQCLQRDKDLRPSMDEVLKILRRIEGGNEKFDDHVEEVDVNGAIDISHNGPIHLSSPPSPDL